MRIARASGVIATAVLGILPLALASACGSSNSSTTSGSSSSSKLEKTNLVVGAVPAETAAALYLAQERGIFAAHGLHVTVKPITSTLEIVPDMVHGSIDIASGQIPSFITAQAHGISSFHLLASGLTLAPGVNEIVALKSSGITNGSQLKGKTIAENALVGDAALLVDSELAIYGTKPSQVTAKTIAFPQMGPALAAHQVDAAYCTEPYCTQMEQKYGARVVADMDEGEAQGLLISGYTVTDAWLKKYPHTAAAFAASIVAASQVADTDLAALQHALIASLHIDPTAADVMATGTFPTSVDLVKIRQVADLMRKFGELQPGFDAAVLTKS
jgi:NitT/TauT family transport system substrate-binding protein